MAKSPSKPRTFVAPAKPMTGTYGQEDFSEAARRSKSETTRAGSDPKKGVPHPNYPWPKA